MRIKTLVIFFLIFFVHITQAQNSLSIPDLKAGIGEKNKIKVELTNKEPVIGVEFTLILPKGLIVYEKESVLNQERKGDDHALFVNIDKEGNYHFMIFSYSNKTFKANNGPLVEIPIEIPVSYKEGQWYDINIKNAIVSSTDIKDIGSGHKGGKLIINKDSSPDLLVSEVSTRASELIPNEKITVSWKVKNIGKNIASGGWTEQISLISEKTGQKYLLGNVFYENNLNVGENSNRQGEFILPKILGFDGSCKLEVKVIPEPAVKEPESDRDNNISLSAHNYVVNKKLFIEADKKEIKENSNEKIKFILSRSGDNSSEQKFLINSSLDGQLNLPSYAIIKKGESSVAFYANAIDNTLYDGNRAVKIEISGNEYPKNYVEITIIDDEIPYFNISATKDQLNSGEKTLINIDLIQASSQDIKISLETDYSKRLKIPEEIVLKAGKTHISFEAEYINSQIPEIEVNAKIIARAVGYKQENIGIKLNKANIPTFEFTISPSTISEGDGSYATSAVIRRLDNFKSNVTLLLKADLADALLLPSKIVFVEGQTQQKFFIGAVDNSIVEGTREVTITASLLFPNCGCSGGSSGIANTEYQSKVTILDNDGLALLVKASPSTVKAGIQKAGKIVISRNTVRSEDINNSLLVNLSTDSPTIVDIPKTAEIFPGQKSVEVEFNTIIDPNKKGDQTIRIQAEADKYSSGFGWLLVTDQNKPDAIITSITIPSKTEGGALTEVVSQLKNQGFATLPKGMKIEYYLSTNTSINNLKPFDVTTLNEEVKPGKSLDFKHSIQFPYKAGTFNLIIVLNSDKNTEELSYINNQFHKEIELLPSYTAEIKVDKNVYKPGEVIHMEGLAKHLNGSLAANKPVDIIINNGNFIRTFAITTNSLGNFAYDFVPLQGENGHYEISSGYPGAKFKSQDEFDLLGVEWINKPLDFLKWEVTEGTEWQGEFKLKNNTHTNLTNVNIKLPSETDFTVKTQSINLKAGQEGTIKYSIIPKGPSSIREYSEIKAEFISEEGVKTPFTSWYYCHTEQAKLIADPVNIATTMVKGKSRLYELKIINIGSTNAKNIKIDIPKLEWLKLKSPQKIDQLGSTDTLTVVLELKPTEKQQINVPLTGNLSVNLSNGTGVSIPFKIETVSEDKGTLQIDVVDEYTYNTEKAPHVQGAKVVVRHPYTGVVVAEGETDNNGVFSAENIPEGWYKVTVSAHKHDSYQNNFEVEPGKNNKQTVFLAYQAVSYQWVVKPTEIEDQYQTDLDVKFETNVPKPVLIVDIDKSVIDLEIGQSKISYVTITNHGLINALDAKISIRQINGYSFTPLIDRLDVIQAKTSVIIPVLIEKIPESRSILTCFALFDVMALFPCGPSLSEIAASGNFIVVGDCDYDINSPIINIDDHNIRPSLEQIEGNINTPSSITPIVINIPDACDWSCVIGILNTIFTCHPAASTVKEIGTCAISLMTTSDYVELASAVVGCGHSYLKKLIKLPSNCVISTATTIYSCVGSLIDYLKEKNSQKRSSYDDDLDKLNKFLLIADDFTAIDKADKAQDKRNTMIFNDENWDDNDDFYLLLNEVAEFLDNDKKFSLNERINIKQNLKNTAYNETYIDNFFERWNSSVEAWNMGVLSPNKEFPNIISKDSLNHYKKEIEDVNKYVTDRGYQSAEKMYQDDLEFIYAERKEMNEKSSSVCATVSVRFSQKMTMTREAFEGTLDINNSTSKEIKDINLDLVITDEEGNDSTHLFQINKDDFLSGVGIVKPNSSGLGTVIYIPTKDAAPTLSKSYSFGGTLSYFDPEIGEKVNVKLFPVTLEVNPSPDLVLHYFMQRDIIGDDPLTEKVEPMVPAEMSLLIKNEGYGIAKNVKVQSMQPEIIENKKGLLIDFEMIGSAMNNNPKQLGLLDIEFGNIAPQKSMVGQWWFTSSLLGHFVKYDIKVKHLNSYGNKDLSLIKEYKIHELIKSVKAYGEGHDDIADFLVNDIPDLNDTPDMIYYSNGESEEVSQASSITVSNDISPKQLTTQLSFNPLFMGWNYGNTDDPGKNLYKLVKVVRNSDKIEMPVENFWQTFVTLRDGKDPKYENKLHFVDKVSGNSSYTLYYSPIETNLPKVLSFTNVPENTTTQPVEYVQVNFNKSIQKETFTYKNLKLIYQGATISLNNNNVKIGAINDSVYVVDLKPLTQSSGYYELTVQCDGIRDINGNSGNEGKSVSWTQVINELGIMQITSDQNKCQPLNSIEVIFNKKVLPKDFTQDKITLNGKVRDITITNVAGGLKYSISGLEEYNKENGSYELAINLPDMISEDGSKGLVIQKYTWKVDKINPEIDQFELKYQGSVHTQNVTDVLVTVNKPLATEFNSEWIKLYKGSTIQNVEFEVLKQDALHYLISGLGIYTQQEGSYKLIVDQSNFIDEHGNYGNGTASKNWQVNFDKPLGVINMHITPDRGISSTDHITSGDDVKLLLETIEDKRIVAIYVSTPMGETLIQKINKDAHGVIEIPIGNYKGKNTFKAIVYDYLENASNPVTLETYIDGTQLGANFIEITKKSQSCSEIESLNVIFTEDIDKSEFTSDALIVKAGGVKLSIHDLKISSISDREFTISNVESLKNNGDIVIGIDLSYLHKKISGLQGNGIVTNQLGEIYYYQSEISGPLSSLVNSTNTYVATKGMNEYKWSVTGGIIVNNNTNEVSIQWIEKGDQIITLEYQTPTLCEKSVSINVKIDDALAVDDIENDQSKVLRISPVPNKGNFKLFMKGNKGIYTLSIYDQSGKIIYNEEKVKVTDDFHKEVNISPIQSGIYYVILHNSKKSFKIKILVD